MESQLYIESIEVTDDISGKILRSYKSLQEYMDAEGEKEEKTYICEGCGRIVPWSDGGADDMPGHCDLCWNQAHRPQETTPISSDITYV